MASIFNIISFCVGGSLVSSILSSCYGGRVVLELSGGEINRFSSFFCCWHNSDHYYQQKYYAYFLRKFTERGEGHRESISGLFDISPSSFALAFRKTWILLPDTVTQDQSLWIGSRFVILDCLSLGLHWKQRQKDTQIKHLRSAIHRSLCANLSDLMGGTYFYESWILRLRCT